MFTIVNKMLYLDSEYFINIIYLYNLIMAEEIQKNNEEEKKEAEWKEKSKEIDEVLKCQKERDEYLDGWKRAKADLINYKKDEAKRFETIIKFSQEAIIRDLINILDSFDLAILAW